MIQDQNLDLLGLDDSFCTADIEVIGNEQVHFFFAIPRHMKSRSPVHMCKFMHKGRLLIRGQSVESGSSCSKFQKLGHRNMYSEFKL